jgi:N6-adenosine-specific RNA methylase IME4
MTSAQKQQRWRDLHNPKSKLYQQLTRKRRREELERALGAATITAWDQLGTRLFPVLYVDWPSRIEPWSRETGLNKAADNHFTTMPLGDVLTFPLPAADNCVLFMWIAAEWFGERYPDTGDMQAILASKGFQYRAHCIWDKGNEDGTGQMGLGHWFRYEHEVLVVGVRGAIPAPSPGTQWRSVIRHPRPRLSNGRIDHSRKPEVFAEMITGYFPTAPKLELFYRVLEDSAAETARRAEREATGWFFWGNEAETRERGKKEAGG